MNIPQWMENVPRTDIERLSTAGFGGDVVLGSNPAVVVIDVVEAFLGSRRSADDPPEKYPTACGPAAWNVIAPIGAVLEAARDANVPRVFTKGSMAETAAMGGAIKLSRDAERATLIHGSPFPDELQVPTMASLVIEKAKASIFFGTPLQTFLVQHGIDSLILLGGVTSGCVRASAVDAYSLGYSVFVVEDGCFDRSAYSHSANLFDIQMKYGSVIDSDECVGLIRARRA